MGQRFGMNTASIHEFEFEYGVGEFGVFKFMIIPSAQSVAQYYYIFIVSNS